MWCKNRRGFCHTTNGWIKSRNPIKNAAAQSGSWCTHSYWVAHQSVRSHQRSTTTHKPSDEWNIAHWLFDLFTNTHNDIHKQSSHNTWYVVCIERPWHWRNNLSSSHCLLTDRNTTRLSQLRVSDAEWPQTICIGLRRAWAVTITLTPFMDVRRVVDHSNCMLCRFKLACIICLLVRSMFCDMS